MPIYDFIPTSTATSSTVTSSSTSTSSTANPTSSLSTTTAEADVNNSTSLSVGARAGIGVGVAIGVLLIIAAIVVIVMRRSKRKNRDTIRAMRSGATDDALAIGKPEKDGTPIDYYNSKNEPDHNTVQPLTRMTASEVDSAKDRNHGPQELGA